MRVFGKRNDGVTGRRKEARKRTLLPVVFKSFSRLVSVDLLNVSETGARLRGSGFPPVHQGILIKAQGVEAFGTVVWLRAGMCGVHFDEPLSKLAVHNLEHASTLCIRANLSPFEQVAAEDWATGYAR